MKITNSPWGKVQTQKMLAPGIFQVTTAGHGGIYLAPELYAQMPEPMKSTGYSSDGWYEEDCDWALVALQFPEAFDEKALGYAKKMIGDYITAEMVADSTVIKNG